MKESTSKFNIKFDSDFNQCVESTNIIILLLYMMQNIKNIDSK
jgi:hypothetical protein